MFVCFFSTCFEYGQGQILHPGQSNLGLLESLKKRWQIRTVRIRSIDRDDDPRDEELEFGDYCFQSGKGKEILDRAIVSLIREHTLRLLKVGNRKGITVTRPSGY